MEEEGGGGLHSLPGQDGPHTVRPLPALPANPPPPVAAGAGLDQLLESEETLAEIREEGMRGDEAEGGETLVPDWRITAPPSLSPLALAGVPPPASPAGNIALENGVEPRPGLLRPLV